MSVVETTTFRLAAGADEKSFLASDRRVQTELVPNQPGFLRRTTARRDDRWLVVVLWATDADAAAFDEVAAQHPAQLSLEGHLDRASIERHRYDTLD
ncbi:MAG: hypothetical protein ACLPVF_11510 [Acidimicrobiales bacterium]